MGSLTGYRHGSIIPPPIGELYLWRLGFLSGFTGLGTVSEDSFEEPPSLFSHIAGDPKGLGPIEPVGWRKGEQISV